MDTDSIKENYIEKYDKQGPKYIITTLISLLLICIFLPYMVTLFIKDTYPRVNGIAEIQVILFILAGLFCLGIFVAVYLKNKKKLLSLLIFESSQYILLLLFILSSHFLVVYLMKDLWLQGLSVFLFVFGIGKIYLDFQNKRSRQKQTDKILKAIGKYGGFLYLIVVVLRLIIGFIDQNIERSMMMIVFPLGMVVAEVFITEYALERIFGIKEILKKQEYYRQITEVSIKDWYGSRSKEYLSKEIKD